MDSKIASRLKPIIYAVLCAAIVGLIVMRAVPQQLHKKLPGGLARNRDCIAVAITYVKHGLWDGYASYRSINESLLHSGLTVQTKDLNKLGYSHYFDVMANHSVVQKAMDDAAYIQTTSNEAKFYMQDEKGLAIFYIMAFKLFGIKTSSLFYLFFSIYLCSAFAACFTFRKHLEVLYLLLAATCALYAITFILPEMPKQDINLIQSSRLLGLLSIPATFHIILCILYKIDRATINIFLLILQTILLFLVINARASALWQLLSILSVGICKWIYYLASVKFKDSHRIARPNAWPLCIILCGLLGLSCHQQFGYNEYFNGPKAQRGHVFWHNLITSLHNNPSRSEIFGIPKQYPVYDDQIGYYIFEEELTKRDENYSNYLVGDDDWVFRTTSPKLDFQWDKYDNVLKDVFLRTIYLHPGYAFESFFIYQPLALIQILWQLFNANWQHLASPYLIIVMFIGTIMTGASFKRITNLTTTIGTVLLFSLLPVFVAAVIELRVPEVLYILLLSTLFSLGLILNFISITLQKAAKFIPFHNAKLGAK